MKAGLILIVFLQGLSLWAGEFTGHDAFAKSLSRFTSYQSAPSSCSLVDPQAGSCSESLRSLVKNDHQHRLLGTMKSLDWICKADFDAWKTDIKQPELLQESFEKNKLGYLGKFTNETARTCLYHADSKNNETISKFYYYATRLNEASSKIIQEEIYLDRYLKEKNPTVCPNPQVLAAANDVCQKMQGCPQQQDFEALAKRVESDEIQFEIVGAKLEKLPPDCQDDESCIQQKAGLSAEYVGLLGRNPWFTNAGFKQERRHRSVKERLRKYMELARDNLRDQQEKIQQTALCIHGANKNREDCDIADMREVLDATNDLPARTDGDGTGKVLNHYFQYQSCMEEKSLIRDHPANEVKGAVKGAGLAFAGLWLGARWALVKGAPMAFSALAGLLGADLTVNVLSSEDAWKAVAAKCFTHDTISFQYKNLSSKNVCENAESALSPGQQEQGGCMVNAGLAALSALPFGTTAGNAVKIARNSGYLKSTARVVDTVAKESLSAADTEANQMLSSEVKSGSKSPRRRSTDVATNGDRRASQISPPSCGLCHTDKSTELTAIANPPESVKIIEGQRADGSKALYYRYPEKLADGTWVAAEREFQMDDITGAINANYPAGRILFEKLAQAKAGKSYFAFFDVGSLGFVNNQFKAGTVAGDRYLKGVAEKIMKLGEGKITLARTGGDEFGMIIDETDPVKAHALIEKIQKEIRKDLTGDAKRIFFEEKVARAQEFRENLKKLEAENPEGVTDQQKAVLLQDIRDLSRVQQPDVSIGITQVGHEDGLTDLSGRAESQATQMKISTALEFGRSAEKYGSKATPNARPKPMYLAQVQKPLPSPSWAARPVSDAAALPSVDGLRLMSEEPTQELARFSNISVVQFEDELGRVSFKTERFYTDSTTGKRIPVISDIPTRGGTGLLDGTYPEGQRLISAFVDSSPSTALVMPKLKSLKYLNYFESGTQAGDQILEAVAEVIKKNTRVSDLNFKLGGADFLMGIKDRGAQELKALEQKISEQLKTHPKVVAVLARESAALTARLAKATAAGDAAAIKEVQQRIQDLKNFNLDLQFQTLPNSELGKNPSLKDVQKKFDDKFKN